MKNSSADFDTVWGDVTADSVSLIDSSGYFATDDVESALQDLAKQAFHEFDVRSVASSSGTLTLSFQGYRHRTVFTTTLTENVSTLTLSSLPASGYIEYELHITQNGTGGWTFAMPASHKALGGSDTAIASAANAVTVLSACTVDGGTTWRYAMQESA